VRRLMRQEGLAVATTRRRRYSSYLGDIGPAPENLINRDFQAAAPNEKWLSADSLMETRKSTTKRRIANAESTTATTIMSE
jgi:transposase InsO family protein